MIGYCEFGYGYNEFSSLVVEHSELFPRSKRKDEAAHKDAVEFAKVNITYSKYIQ